MSFSEKMINWLLENVSQYRISKETGISQGKLSGIKNGRTKISNLTLEVSENLVRFAKKEFYKDYTFSYDYDEMIEEFEMEAIGGEVEPDEKVKVIRKDLDYTDYRPIVEYFFEGDEMIGGLEPGETIETMTAKQVIDEMRDMTRVIR